MKPCRHDPKDCQITFDFKDECPANRKGGLRIGVWLPQHVALRLIAIVSIMLGLLSAVAALSPTTLI